MSCRNSTSGIPIIFYVRDVKHYDNLKSVSNLNFDMAKVTLWEKRIILTKQYKNLPVDLQGKKENVHD